MSFGDTNYIRITRILESVLGVTPTSGKPTELRVTGQSLNYNAQYTRSEEIRQDRMTSDTILTDAEANGAIPVEMSFGNADDLLEAVLFNSFQNLPVIVNSAADTEITGITDADDTFTVASGGTVFKAGHLVRSSGFTDPANNLVFKVASSTGTTVVGATLSLADEPAPPEGASLRVVGFQGSAGDIVAAVGPNRLLSTTLDFTTLGILPGHWLKIGGAGTGNRFGTAQLNGWVRVKSVSANVIVLDRVPTDDLGNTWAADTGATKTIKVWFGDFLKNGKVRKSFSFQREHTDIGQFFQFRGMTVNTFALSLATGQILRGEFNYMGMGSNRDSVTMMPGGGDVIAAPEGDVMNSVRDVVSIMEGGGNPGTLQSMTLNLGNNLRGQKGIGKLGNAGIGVGDFDSTIEFTAYFENGSLYDKWLNSVETSLSFITVQDGQGYIYDAPRVKVENCVVQAGQRNQDCTLQVTARALRDKTLAAQVILQRVHYFED